MDSIDIFGLDTIFVSSVLCKLIMYHYRINTEEALLHLSYRLRPGERLWKRFLKFGRIFESRRCVLYDCS